METNVETTIKTAVETRFHKLSDKEVPAQSTVDKVWAMLEERHAEAMNLKEAPIRGRHRRRR